MFVGVAASHVILLQKSNLSLIKNQDSNGFCPEQADTDTAFVEFSK